MRWITPAAQSRAWIMSFTGRHVTPLQPTTDMLCIEDIAHHLSHEARYNGATREFYSVAEHSVRVSWLVPKAYALEGLLHDASEAYLKDIPAPLKRQDAFAEYREAEERLGLCVAAKFGLYTWESAAVKHWDKVLGATERRDIMRNDEAWVAPTPPWPNGTVMPWSADDARAMYLRRYADLVMSDYGDQHALGYCRSCHGVLALTREGNRPLIGGFWRHVCGDCGGDFGHQLVRADAPAGWQP
jgi:hypothetical protein